jgi:ADP-ribose pyrophosphatase YjhB (NUDIX family)
MEQPAQASVRGLIEDDGRFLFVTHRTRCGSEAWTLPGGRARIGEDPREAVAREVFENLPDEELKSDAEFAFLLPQGYNVTDHDNGNVVFIE